MGALFILPAVVAAVEVGRPAPAFDLPNIDGGGNVSLQSLKGKVVVIDFWASWCGPCIKAMPELDALQQHYGSKGVQVVAISIDEELASARGKLKQGSHRFLPLHDADSAVAGRYGVGEALPSTIVIDRQGTVRFAKIGGAVPAAELRRIVESLL